MAEWRIYASVNKAITGYIIYLILRLFSYECIWKIRLQTGGHNSTDGLVQAWHQA